MRPRTPTALWKLLPVAACLALCLAPHLSRLRGPSLYADDVDRVAQLQTETLGGMLFAPFNEHLAPLFQLVSRLTWESAGHSLARAPLTFTLASFLPFVLTLGLLARVLSRETRSTTAALAGVGVFSLSWVAVETVYWYSASSFMWSLLMALVAWSAAEPGAGVRGWGGRGLALLAAASAPAFSMIGVLAGPAAAVRAVATSGKRAWADALAPLAGSLLFLGAYGVWHDRAVVSANVEQNAGVLPGLVATTRAPAAALVPALFSLRTLPTTGSAGVAMSVLSAATAVGLLLRARQEPGDRPMILGGLLLIVGGYALTFCARAGVPGRALMETQRYHLFPMLGLVFVLTPWLRRACDRWFAGPIPGAWGAVVLAAVLLVLHQSEMRGRARFLKFPDQARTLAALDRLEAVCVREGVTRAQALAALDPVEAPWAPEGRSLFVMLGPCAPSPRVPDPDVKATLLASLTPTERPAVCGGMDATPYLRPVEGSGRSTVAVGRAVDRFRVREGGGGRLVSAGWPAFVEYEMGLSAPGGTDALGLTFEGDAAAGVVEVWWKGEGGKWSGTRSVRLRPQPGPEGDWLLPFDRLPHFDPAEARRVRLLFHAEGPVALGAPKLLR